MLYHKEITEKIIGAAIEVHRILGPGLLESAYEECLNYELANSELRVQRQKILPLVYKEARLDASYRIDLLVENKIILELKAVESINDIHRAQLITYLKLSGCSVGLLLNFNVSKLTDGLQRLVV
ncbi:MAG: GxxExxY protein [Bacteroidetes bacterium]|nr:GxxExxY protein [Bacteroidota bacterium]